MTDDGVESSGSAQGAIASEDAAIASAASRLQIARGGGQISQTANRASIPKPGTGRSKADAMDTTDIPNRTDAASRADSVAALTF